MRSGMALLLISVVAGVAGMAWLGPARAGAPRAAAPPPPPATPEAYKSPGALAAQQQRDLQRGVQYPLLAHGNPRLKVVALTFDDGPHPQYTPQLLAILGQHNVKATFFVVGRQAQQNPALIRLERAQGHLVGNHTYDHQNLTKIPEAQVAAEWRLCQETVRQITGETMRFCRPPGGDYNRHVVRAASQLGLTTVLWTDDPGDYASPGEKAIDARVLRRVGNGGIILLHDGIQQTVDILPRVIQQLRDRGFRFVTVAELEAGLGDARPRK
jgi:peptidoglycan/xylan/chitin deacetylase (PgdA/CDA1 family)